MARAKQHAASVKSLREKKIVTKVTASQFRTGETVVSIMQELEALGSESIRKVLRKHGARDPFYGVRIGDMKPIVKRIKIDYQLALEL